MTDSMYRYQAHAWNDALELATWLMDEFSEATVKEYRLRIDSNLLLKQEGLNRELVRDFIELPPSKRPAYLKRVGLKEYDFQMFVFVILAINGLVRAKDAFQARDNHSAALLPGRSYRSTSGAAYKFHEVLARSFMATVQFPDVVFEACGFLFLDSERT